MEITVKMSGVRTERDAILAYRAANDLRVAHPDHPTGKSNAQAYIKVGRGGPRKLVVYRTKTMYRVEVLRRNGNGNWA